MHITHICPRFKEVHGGGEPVLIHLFSELAALGHANTVLTLEFPASMRHQVDSRVNIRQLPCLFSIKLPNILLQGFFDLFASLFLPLGIPRHTDVVCFHTETVIPGLFFYRLLTGTKPCVYFCFQPPRFAYDTSLETASSGATVGKLVPTFSLIYRPFDRFTVRLAIKVLTFSTDYKRWIESIYGIKGVEVLPPGVEEPWDLEAIPKHISTALAGEGIKTVVFVGKLVAWKNVSRLIRIISAVKEKIPSIKCLIVGDGPCMNPLRSLAAELALEDTVFFCGYVGPRKVFAYCSASDLFVLLEQNVSFGLSLVEANACGVPVMAFEGGGPSDIIRNGKNGYILPKDSSDDFISDQITNILSDEELLKKMKAEARECSRQYSWKRFAERFAAVSKPDTEKSPPLRS